MKNSETIRTIIFDLDGTLIDTEKYYRVLWPQAARDLGYEMTDEMSLQLRSLGRPFSPQLFKEWYGSEEAYWKIRTHRVELVQKTLEERGIEFKKGAVETLSWLKEQGITIAMATANGYEKTMDYLKRLGIAPYFDKVICATMVSCGKPAPDVYTYACEQLGLAPELVYAVEDSPNGVLSAYRAGCKVIMVPDQTEPDEELEKLLFMKANDLTELMTLFQTG